MNRIPPRMSAGAYKTYQILQPLESHFRDATCQEVDCQAFANGWRSMVDTSTPLGARQANYIRLHSGRAYTSTENAAMVTFVFRPGQRCFTSHRLPLGRPNLFVVRDGDWRGNPHRTDPQRRSAADWVDDFATHQDKLATRFKEG